MKILLTFLVSLVLLVVAIQLIDTNRDRRMDFDDDTGPIYSIAYGISYDGGFKNGYISSITYDRDTGNPTANDITITWYITLNWDWDDATDIEFGVKAVDDNAADSGYSTTTTENKIYDDQQTIIIPITTWYQFYSIPISFIGPGALIFCTNHFIFAKNPFYSMNYLFTLLFGGWNAFYPESTMNEEE